MSQGKPPSEVAVAPAGAVRAVYEPGAARLSIYGSAPQTLELSAQLDAKVLPGEEFETRFTGRFRCREYARPGRMRPRFGTMSARP